MNTASVVSVLAGTSAALTFGLLGAPAASAELDTTTFGDDAQLTNNGVVQAWVVSDLRPSSDVIDYPVHGTLWEATATDVAVVGSATPIVSNFNARTPDGHDYRVLFGAATPLGVNPATLAQGDHTTGKLYFDVTGPAPETVVYNSMGTDLAQWVAPPPAPPAASGGQWNPPAGAEASQPATAGVDGEDAAEAPPLGAEGTADELPAGSQGTPLAEGSTGTPVEAAPEAAGEGSTGTPLPATGSTGTPLPTAGSTGTPLPTSGSTGTPLEAQAPASPVPAAPAVPEAPAAAPASPQPEAAPAGSQGAPVTPAPTTTVIAPPPS